MFSGPVMEDPVNLEERLAAAGKCVADLKLPMRAVVDKLDDAVGRAYSGWPDRLYLVGRDGNIAYAGGRGPFEFSPDELERAIQTELAKTRQ